jgi:hypothetical protein
VTDRAQFSPKLLGMPDAKSDHALERVAVAKSRIQSILDRDTVCNQKTLEQKVAEQGPKPMRVDPHLVGLAILDLLQLNRLNAHTHESTKKIAWFANLGTKASAVTERLAELAPLYAQITGNGFGNLTGDALELVIWKCLDERFLAQRRFAYQGHFDLAKPKKNGRYSRVAPPKTLNGKTTTGEADFYQFGYDEGPLCIECKNYREWFYPHQTLIKELIIKADALDALPVLIVRRLHYTTRTNFLEPAGIIAHESLLQYYPADQAALAERVKHARNLGFTDVTATEEPHARTRRFFSELLPALVPRMAASWFANRNALVAYAKDELNLAQLYTEIASPAGGKWEDKAAAANPYMEDPPF